MRREGGQIKGEIRRTARKTVENTELKRKTYEKGQIPAIVSGCVCARDRERKNGYLRDKEET